MHEERQPNRFLVCEEPTDLLLDSGLRRVIVLVLGTEALILKRGLLTFPRIVVYVAPLQIRRNIQQSFERIVCRSDRFEMSFDLRRLRTLFGCGLTEIFLPLR